MRCCYRSDAYQAVRRRSKYDVTHLDARCCDRRS